MVAVERSGKASPAEDGHNLDFVSGELRKSHEGREKKYDGPIYTGG